MSEDIKWLLIDVAMITAFLLFVLLPRRKKRLKRVPALTGTVPADQSFPFNAEEFLARAGCPEYTVFEFVVDSGKNDRVELPSFTLSSAEGENALAGDYVCPVKGTDSTEFTFANTSQTVTIDFTKRPEGGLTLEKGAPVSIVVPALPRPFGGLSVTFTGDPIGRKTLKLSYSEGAPLVFKAHTRHRLYGLSLPEGKSE